MGQGPLQDVLGFKDHGFYMFTNRYKQCFMLPLKPCLELFGGIMSNIANFQQILFICTEQEERVKVRDKRVQTVQVKTKQGGNKTPLSFLLPVIGYIP